MSLPAKESMGLTPLDVEMEPTGKPIKFRVDLDGYRAEVVSFAGDTDATKRVRLAPKNEAGKKPAATKIGDGTYNPFK